MNKKDLLKKDRKLKKMKDKLFMNVLDFIINEGISKSDIMVEKFEKYLMITTDENWNNRFILENLEKLNLESIKIISSCDKYSIITLSNDSYQ